MKLSLLPLVELADVVRQVVLAELAALDADNFVVTINGSRQDDALRAVAKPVLERELRGRLASLDRDLQAYGVDVAG
ncbi:MAG: hypothetical protein ABIV63_04260 [Caldimonas sp.]